MISTIDFCCGRTQRDRCRKCGRAFVSAEQLVPLPAPPTLDLELSAFRNGVLIGFALGLAVAGLIILAARSL